MDTGVGGRARCIRLLRHYNPPFGQKNSLEFRLAQLLLLFEVAGVVDHPLGLDRLGYYDFFAANPFLVVGESDQSRVDLRLAGFSSLDRSIIKVLLSAS